MPEHPELTIRRVRELRQSMARGIGRHTFSLAVSLLRETRDMPDRIEQGRKTVMERPEYFPYLDQLVAANEQATKALDEFLGLLGVDWRKRAVEVLFDAEEIDDGDAATSREVRQV